MNILGLHVNTDQTSAALLQDGTFIAAAGEERFNRIKRCRDFPFEAIRYCLAQAGLEGPEELDAIALSWNPGENMRHINMSGFTSWRRYDPEWLYILPNNIMGMRPDAVFESDTIRMNFVGGPKCAFHFVEHHKAHLAHAVHHSPFEAGLVMAIDEYSEYDSVTIATFKGNDINIIKRIPYPHSLGVFYSAMTEYLGFAPNSEEWKVMGAAAYGTPDRFRDKLGEILSWDAKRGEWRLDIRLIQHVNLKRAGYLSEDLIDFMELPPRGRNDELQQVHFDLAAAAQAVFEERVFQLINHYAPQAPAPNLAAAGGCFMNSLCNGRITTHTPMERVFVPVAAADNGGAMGSALHVWHQTMGNARRIEEIPCTPYLGPEYTADEIKAELDRCGLKYEKLDDPAGYAAKRISEGALIGWHQGRMEYGERALGNRSILADPREASMKGRINTAVKFREAFRPFAPSILEERAQDWFEMPKGATVPYMEQVFPIRAERQEAIPAVVHADGTGRLQTVSAKLNPLYHELIRKFEALTGVPIVLNTSFNVQGQPIVMTPSDAVRTFFTCGLQECIIGSFILRK